MQMRVTRVRASWTAIEPDGTRTRVEYICDHDDEKTIEVTRVSEVA